MSRFPDSIHSNDKVCCSKLWVLSFKGAGPKVYIHKTAIIIVALPLYIEARWVVEFTEPGLFRAGCPLAFPCAGPFVAFSDHKVITFGHAIILD